MAARQKKNQLIFIIYWVLLSYIIAALIWWFIALSTQNREMAQLKETDLRNAGMLTETSLHDIKDQERRKNAQYIGEGVTFFLLILGGAIFVYRAVKRQLKQSQEQQNFMMAVTHELKTPIAVAKLNLETLQKRKLEEAQQNKLIQNTLEEANRLNALCNNMLISSQIEAGGYRFTKEELNLSDILESAIDDHQGRYAQRLFTRNIREGIYIQGDQVLLQIAFNNLLENAIKYSPKETAVNIELVIQNSTALISIADQGPGIAAEERKKVFRKFYRLGNEATRQAKGTGLGLYLTRRIVLAHKGNININDNPQGGSIFVISLPAES